MSRCLKCNYELTFLKRRHRYRCAKCSSLFTEEEIKLEEFKKYNKAQRAEEKEEVEKEIQILIKHSDKGLGEKEKKEKKLEIQRKYREEYREEHNLYRREYWAKHRERLLVRRKETTDTTKQNKVRKTRRANNIESTRLNGRIEYWKRKQKIMAESRFDDFLINKVFNRHEKILPTLVLA